MPLVAFFQPLYRNCHWHFPTWGWKDGTIPTKPSHAQDQLRLRLTLPLPRISPRMSRIQHSLVLALGEATHEETREERNLRPSNVTRSVESLQPVTQ